MINFLLILDFSSSAGSSGICNANNPQTKEMIQGRECRPDITSIVNIHVMCKSRNLNHFSHECLRPLVSWLSLCGGKNIVCNLIGDVSVNNGHYNSEILKASLFKLCRPKEQSPNPQCEMNITLNDSDKASLRGYNYPQMLPKEKLIVMNVISTAGRHPR